MANQGFGRIVRKASEHAKQAVDVLREEYAKGAAGDQSPTAVLFGTTGYDQIKALLRGRATAPDGNEDGAQDGSDTGLADPKPGESATGSGVGSAEGNGGSVGEGDAVIGTGPNGVVGSSETAAAITDEAAAAEVSTVLQRVDWRAVSASAQERTGEVAERMRSLAGDVDWDRMKPVAGKVATALVAAAATGQIGRLSGPTAMAVSRALQSNNVGEAAAAIVSRGPAGIVAGQVMKSFLDSPPTGPAVGGLRLPPRTNVFEAHLAELDDVASTVPGRDLASPASPGTA